MDDSKHTSWRRCCGILFGLGTQILFGVTVWHLFWFLRDGQSASDRDFCLIDGALAIQFAVPHSLLLLPATKRYLTKWFSSALYGCLFCTATCIGLLLLISFWRGATSSLWDLQGWPATVVRVGFYGSWISLLYSLSLTGLGYQTGWTPWWHWFLKRPQPRRQFVPRGAYLCLRHPVYLSFLGLIWFTPHMTWDHVVLTAVWTPYIFVGSVLKDERLAYYAGESYRDYQTRVAGYPLIWFGPLAKRQPSPASGGNADYSDIRPAPRSAA